MTDKVIDKVGIVRRESHEDGYSIWVKVEKTVIDSPGSYTIEQWLCVHSTVKGNRGARLPLQALVGPDTSIIGSVPGTPAAG